MISRPLNARPIDRVDPGLETSLRRAERLIGAAAGVALSLEDPGAIELPPLSTATIDQAQLRAIATLYLAAELEGAGVIPATEALAKLARSGALPLDFGGGAPLLQTFWQGRNQRASAEERLSFFSALFGTPTGTDSAARPPNLEFEDRMIDLCEALYRLEEETRPDGSGGITQQVRIRSAAQRLLSSLAEAAGGITIFMAQEILVTLRQALAILNHVAVKAAFGSRTLWEVVTAIDRRARIPPRPTDQHLRRGQAGLTILAWVADAVAEITTGNRPLIALDHPVIGAAVDWLEASLALGEAAADQTSQPYGPPTEGASPWAGLVG
jgi:hypothetical protein